MLSYNKAQLEYWLMIHHTLETVFLLYIFTNQMTSKMKVVKENNLTFIYILNFK